MKLDLGQLPKQGLGVFFIDPVIETVDDGCNSETYADNVRYHYISVKNPQYFVKDYKGFIKFDFSKIKPDKDDVLDARFAGAKYFGNPMPKDLMYQFDYIGLEHIFLTDKCTVAKWSDGTTTKIALMEGEEFDLVKAVYILYFKKLAEESGSTFHHFLDEALDRVVDQRTPSD